MIAMDSLFNLTGKIAFVTGGGGILCSEMARALAERGAKVAVADLKLEAAEAVAKEIRAAGGEAIGVQCNVLDKASLEAARDVVESEFGSVNLLINGAGGNHPKGTTQLETVSKEQLEANVEGSFFDLDPEGVGFTFNLNFLGTLLPCQVFCDSMARSGGGNVINVSSMSAYAPMTKVPAYSAAKAAVSNFTMWLAVHMAKTGIRVNALAPGFFLTDQNRALLTNPDGSRTERGGKIISQTPMERYGEPSDLLGTLIWLASDNAAGFVTGTVIPIDGGFLAYSGV